MKKGKEFSRTQNSLVNLMTGMGVQFLNIALKFVTRTVFVYTLGKEYLGINGLFTDILTMLSLTELGLDTAITFRMYKPLAERDDKRVRVLLKFYKQAYRLIGGVILVAGLCLIPVLPHLIKDYERLDALGINAVLVFTLYLLNSVCSYLFFAYRSSVLKANQKNYILDVVDFAVKITMNVTQILVLILLKDFLIYTLIIVVFSIVDNLVKAIISQRYSPQLFTKEEDKLSQQEIIGMLKDCGALFVYKVNNVVVKATDNLVISKFIGLVMVGMYSNYLLFYVTIRSLFDKVYAAVKASVGNLYATESVEKRYRFFEFMNFLSVLLFGTSGIGVAICADEFITVWIGVDYVLARPLAILVGIEILFHGMRVNLGQTRNVSGAFRQMWFRPILGIIINLGVSIWLVNLWGICGVISGTIIADIMTNFMVDPSVLYKYSFGNQYHVSEYYKKNIQYFIVLAVVGAADFWFCGHFLTGYGWLSVIIHILIVGLSVPSVLVALFWRSHECQYLVRLSKSISSQVMKKLR